MEAKAAEHKAQPSAVVFTTSASARYSRLVSRLRAQCGRVTLSKRRDLPDALDDARADGDGPDLLVVAAPDEAPTEDDVSALRRHVEGGGCALLMTGEGLEAADPEAYGRLSRLTAEYGVQLRDEAVVRTTFSRDFLHPKEAVVDGPATAPGLADAVGRVVHPFGHTLVVQSPAVPLLSSRGTSFPANRPLAALASGGRLAVLASARALDDEYIDRADNGELAAALAAMLLRSSAAAALAGAPPPQPPRVPEDAPEFALAAVEAPDVEALAERVRPCLQEPDEMPADFTRLFDHRFFAFETALIPEAVRLYRRLRVKHEPLDLIPPEFSVVHPPLQPAVFLPATRELPAPPLELFDLDDEFSSEGERLAQLSNKCQAPGDLDYYVTQAGRVLGVVGAGEEDATPGLVLERVLRALVEYKKVC